MAFLLKFKIAGPWLMGKKGGRREGLAIISSFANGNVCALIIT